VPQPLLWFAEDHLAACGLKVIALSLSLSLFSFSGFCQEFYFASCRSAVGPFGWIRRRGRGETAVSLHVCAQLRPVPVHNEGVRRRTAAELETRGRFNRAVNRQKMRRRLF